MKSLAIISNLAFLSRQISVFASVLLADYRRDITDNHVIALSIAAVMLYPAAIRIFTIREGKSSVRYRAAPAGAGRFQ